MNIEHSVPVKLYQSLFILQKCDTVIQRLIERTVSKGDQLDLKVSDFELVDNSTLIILQLSIFLDEYEKQFHRVETEYHQRVIVFKKIICPIVDHIKKWKDLRTFRNRFVAHNCRDDAGTFYLPDISRYDVPHSALDFVIASDCMSYIMKLMMKEFDEEMMGMTDYILNQAPPVKYHHTIIATNKELDQMQNEVNKLCLKHKKEYQLTHTMRYLPPEEDE